MKRILIIIVVLIAGFSGGWYAHARFGNWPYSDLQWKFVEAVRSGDIAEMERLYQKGARLGIGVYYPGGGEGGSPPILAAAEAAQPAAVKWLLDHGEIPNSEYQIPARYTKPRPVPRMPIKRLKSSKHMAQPFLTNEQDA